MNAYHIVENTLNLRTVRIFDTVIGDDGNEKQVLNKRETAIAQDKQDMIKEQFAEWIWKDPNRRDKLCKLYNSRFNSIRPREYDGQHMLSEKLYPLCRGIDEAAATRLATRGTREYSLTRDNTKSL